MNQASFVSLIYNAALLLTLGIIYDSISYRMHSETIGAKILSGIFIGLITIAIMLNPWVLEPGVVFDTRSIILSISAMFLGFAPALISGVMAIAFRLFKGGDGAIVGSLVVVSSIVIGLIWRRYQSKGFKKHPFWELYTMGVFTSATMISLMLLLPHGAGVSVIALITLPVITIYPLVTVLLGHLLALRIRRREEGQTIDKLMTRQKAILSSVPDIIMEVDNNKVYTWANQAGYDFFGLDVIGRKASDYFVGEQKTLEVVQPLFEGDEHLLYVESWQRRQDGQECLLAWWCKVLKDEQGGITGALSTARDITGLIEADKALKQSQEKYRRIVETAYEGIWTMDENFNTNFVNAQTLKMLGYTEEEMLGKNVHYFMHPDDLLDHGDKMQRRTMGKDERYERRFIRKDGSVLWALVSANAIQDEQGNFGGSFAMVTDISDIIEAQNALKVSKSQFEQFMNQIPGNVFIKDTQSRLLYANKHMIQDHSAHDWIGKSPYEVFSNEEAEEIVTTDLEVMEKGYMLMHDHYKNADGKDKYYETMKFTIASDEGEVLIGGISMDVTTRAVAEKERNKYALRMELINKIDSLVLESKTLQEIGYSLLQCLNILIPSSIISINELYDGKSSPIVTKVNLDRYAFLQSIPSDTISSEFTAELKAKKRLLIQDTSQCSFSENMPIRNRLIKEGIRSLFYVALLVRDDVMGFVAFASDTPDFFSEEYQAIAIEFANQLSLAINQLRLIDATQKHVVEMEQRVNERTAQLLKANKELESFSYTVAHDLRSPLRSMDGFSKILLEDHADQLDEEGKALLSRVSTNAHKMGNLITALLGLAKITRDSLNFVPVNMNHLVTSILDEVVPIKHKSLFHIEVEDLPDALADEHLIAQVWTNLLTNAVKFTLPQHEKTIRVGSYLQQDKIVYFVRDTGVGFDMKYADKLFSTFQRLHRDDEFEGTGIGLASVKKIVDRHNGEVWAESKLGEGSAFYFALPINPQS